MKRDYLITQIRQVDGTWRRLYAPTRRAAEQARDAIRNDPAAVDALKSWGLLSRVEDMPPNQAPDRDLETY